MSDAFFTPLGEPDANHGSRAAAAQPTTRDGVVERFAAQAWCIGPWSPDAMHGGPPSALLVRACERAAERDLSVGPGMVALRVSVDFPSPVPMGDVEVRAHVVRPGRRVALVEASLRSGGRDVLHARTWLVRITGPDDVPTPEVDDTTALGLAPAEAGTPSADPGAYPLALQTWTFPYATAIEWHTVSGDPEGSGDAAAWARQRIPLVDGEEPSGLQRAVLIADSGNGISAVLDWDAWSFVNVDLDVHLRRPLAGDWVLLDARSRFAPTGTGLASSVLHDRAGVVGSGAQTLVVVPR